MHHAHPVVLLESEELQDLHGSWTSSHSSPPAPAVTKPVAAPHVQEPFPERSIDSLNLVDAMFHWLVHWGRQQDLRAEAAAQRRTLLGAPDSAGRLPTGAHLPREEASGQLHARKVAACCEPASTG